MAEGQVLATVRQADGSVLAYIDRGTTIEVWRGACPPLVTLPPCPPCVPQASPTSPRPSQNPTPPNNPNPGNPGGPGPSPPVIGPGGTPPVPDPENPPIETEEIEYIDPNRELAATCVDTLTDDDIERDSWGWAPADREIINQVTIRFDYDDDLESPTSGQYLTEKTYEFQESIDAFGKKQALEINSKGMRSELGGDGQADERASLIFLRFGYPPPLFRCDKVFFRKNAWVVGDLICVTSDYIPNPETGLYGIADQMMQIIDIAPDLTGGFLSVTLLDVASLVEPGEIKVTTTKRITPALLQEGSESEA